MSREPLGSPEMDQKTRRAREIQDAIRTILLREWDPLDVIDLPGAQDEYDGYIGSVYSWLAAGHSATEVADQLAALEVEILGFSTSAEALLPVATNLCALNVRLDPDVGAA